MAEAAAVVYGIIATTDANKQGVRFDWRCKAEEMPSMYVIILYTMKNEDKTHALFPFG